jgi:dTDP-D-glucose 4,6-dehydratase
MAKEQPRMFLYLPLEMQAELKNTAAHVGISTSELVRNIIDEWRDRQRSEEPERFTKFEALTEGDLRMFVANRFLELSRYAVNQEKQVREIERKAKEAGLTVNEWIKKERGIDII